MTQENPSPLGWYQGLRYCPLCRATRVAIWHQDCAQVYCPIHAVETTVVGHKGQEQQDGETQSEPTE